MRNLLFLIFTLSSLTIFAQPTGYLGVRLNGTNMTNQSFVYNSPGITPTNSRLVQEYKDSTYGRWLYNTIRFDYLGSASAIYLKTDVNGNLQKAPITDIFNPTNYYNKVDADARYLQSYTEQDPLFVTDSNLFARKTYTYSKIESDAKYLQSFTELDPIYLASSWFSTTNNSTNWNTAFGWGNHSIQGYLKGIDTLSLSNRINQRVKYTDTLLMLSPYFRTSNFNTSFDTRFNTKTTTDLTEGTNLYFTNSRALTATSGAYKSISYTPSSAEIITALGYTPANIRDTIGGTGNNSIMTTTSANNSLNSKVNKTTTLTINGVPQDLFNNRTWNVGTVTNVTSANIANLTITNGTTIPALTVVSAPKLQTARTINGQSFDGTANITIPGSSVTSIPNSSLTNSSITINGNSISLGGSTTVTASPSISAPVASNSITSGTAFQPRVGGPCNILINTNVSGVVGVGCTVVVAMSPTSGGTYTQVATDAVSVTILTLGDKASGLIPVPAGYWVRVTYTAVGLATITGNYTRWDL